MSHNEGRSGVESEMESSTKTEYNTCNKPKDDQDKDVEDGAVDKCSSSKMEAPIMKLTSSNRKQDRNK
jgi:hypothetical protein